MKKMEVVIRKTIFGWIAILQPEQKTMYIHEDLEQVKRFCRDNNLTVVNKRAKENGDE